MGEDIPRQRGGVRGVASRPRGLPPPLLALLASQEKCRPRGIWETRSQNAASRLLPRPLHSQLPVGTKLPSSSPPHPGRGLLPGPGELEGASPGMSPYAFVCCLEAFAATESPVRSGLGTELSFSFVKREKDHCEGGGEGSPLGPGAFSGRGPAQETTHLAAGHLFLLMGARGLGRGRWGDGGRGSNRHFFPFLPR